MGLIDRIGAIFKRAETAPVATTSAELPAQGGGPLELAAEWRAATDRRGVVRACREMYATDPRGEAVIATLARDIVRGGFEVSFEAGQDAAAGQQEEAGRIAEELVARLGMDQRLDDWVRMSLRDGDSFLELSVDGNLDIAGVTRKPTLEVRRASDRYDRFPDPRRAFWQADEWAQEPPGNAVWFAEWQIIHARWAHDEGSRYGKPLFSTATQAFKRIKEGETDIAVRRKTRAGVKYVHQFPAGTDTTTIEQYKRINRDTLNNPLSAIADYFGTVDIKMLAGDANLGNIEDVMHHIRTWWLASPVAMSLLGYGQDLNRDVLDKQSEQYQRALEGLTAWPETEIVRPLLERQWLLRGIVPEGLGYSIKWAGKEVTTAAKVRDAADAALKLKAVGMDDETVRALLEMLLPGVTIGMRPSTALRSAQDALAATGLRSAQDAGAGPETRATAGRMARAAEELGR